MDHHSLVLADAIRPLSIVGLVAGPLLVVAGAALMWSTWQETQWHSTSGTMLASDLVHTLERTTREAGSREYWILSVRYRYTVDGRSFVGTAYARKPASERTGGSDPPSPAMQELRDRYRPGTSVPVYYDPKDPTSAVLHTSDRPNWSVLMLGLVVTTLAIWGWTKGAP
jgi:hypothetical protein